MVFPGVGRAVWSAGSSGGGTGRTNAWDTYDGTEDTAWQQMVDDTSTALTSYSATKTEKNTQPAGNEKAYIALTNGTNEYLGVITTDAIDPTSAQIETYGPYSMERCELNKASPYLMLSSLENDGSINVFKDSGTITETGVMTNATLGLRDPGSGERSCSLIWRQQINDSSYNVDYETPAPEGYFLMMGGRSTVTNFTISQVSSRQPSNWPGISVWGTYDIDSVISTPPSDADLLTSWNEGVDNTSTPGTPGGIFKVSGWSGGAWYTFQGDGINGGLNVHYPSESYHPNYPSSPSSPSSDRVFAGYDGSSSYYTDTSSVIRPFLAKRSQDLISEINADPNYDYFYEKTGTQTQQLWVDWRSIRQGGSADKIAVGWTTYETKAGQLGYEKGSGNPNWDVGAFLDPSFAIGSLDDRNDGVYPSQETKLGIINNDRVMFRSNGGRSATELGEDLVQAIQIGNTMWVGMYPDTTGTKGGNLWLNATSITTEDLATAKYNVEPVNVLTSTEDITAEESHSQYSIPVSVVNGSDSTSTAFDPDAATIFALDDPYFAVLWRKSTTAYISIFSITNRASSSLPPLITRVVDAQSLGTVSASDVSGVKMGRGVAMITCGDKYRFIKVPV